MFDIGSGPLIQGATVGQGLVEPLVGINCGLNLDPLLVVDICTAEVAVIPSPL